jgi:hypothetical protein
LLIPANITILALPPKCPELNLVENIWQYMRAHFGDGEQRFHAMVSRHFARS